MSPRQVWSLSVMGGRWVESQGHAGGGLSLRQSSRPLECAPGVPEGYGPAKWRLCVPVDHQLGRL
jgi:hypothetical protein